MNNTVIIAGGCLSKSFLQEYVKKEAFDYVIAVDGALAYVEEASVPIHCLVGDFDTVSEELLQQYMQKKGIYIERHRPEKDETDTELALRIAMERNSKKITILGATGGRLDHFIGNLHLLLQPLKKEIPCVLVDKWNRISLVNRYKKITEIEKFGKYISFLAFTDQVEDVSLIGFKYPLQHATIAKGITLGVSNEMVSHVAEVYVGNGILMCIESRDTSREERFYEI